MKCYFCEEWFDHITPHLVMHDGLYKCPHYIDDAIKHLKPHELSKGEEALDRAWERNR